MATCVKVHTKLIWMEAVFLSYPGKSLPPSIYYDDPDAIIRLENQLSQQFKKLRYTKRFKDVLVLCIGTSRLVGDSLGPLVGSYLNGAGLDYPVLGTVQDPIHAQNLAPITHRLKSMGSKAILAIDSEIGQNIGRLAIKPGPLYPRSGIPGATPLPPVGDILITGTTAQAGDSFEVFSSLESVPVNRVLSMASVLAEVVYFALMDKPIPKPLNLYSRDLVDRFNQFMAETVEQVASLGGNPGEQWVPLDEMPDYQRYEVTRKGLLSNGTSSMGFSFIFDKHTLPWLPTAMVYLSVGTDTSIYKELMTGKKVFDGQHEHSIPQGYYVYARYPWPLSFNPCSHYEMLGKWVAKCVGELDTFLLGRSRRYSWR